MVNSHLKTQNPGARDHGGDYTQARQQYGGDAADWIDLSTGINPRAYPIGMISPGAWADLPDSTALTRLSDAARQAYSVPDTAVVLPASGASSLISLIPSLMPPGRVSIVTPTYNEHAAAFKAFGWTVVNTPADADAAVTVHPNNPDGHICEIPNRGHRLTIIDESFAEVIDSSHVGETCKPGTIILRSFGKFYGLAGLRLGFAIVSRDLAPAVADRLGPWPVSGPAAEVGTRALLDTAWAHETRARLMQDALRLDQMVTQRSAQLVGGTSLFRLYEVEDAAAWQATLAKHHIWSRIFPYSSRWIRLGLPDGVADWARVEAALTRCP